MLACEAAPGLGSKGSLALKGTDGLQGTFADLPVLLEDSMQRSPDNVADGILLDLGMSSMQAGASLDNGLYACSPVSLVWLQQVSHLLFV